MFIARCKRCGNILGAIRDPGKFTWLKCMECGFNNYITWVIDPLENYQHPNDKISLEREADLHADGMKNVIDAGVFGK